jgi:HD-like signal output (HDOD) protein
MSQAATGIGANPDHDQLVQTSIREISHIATLPEVTLKIISLVEDPESTAQDLNNIISNDPALGARILKVVNSAFYGLPGQIGSINRAIVLLGLNAVKNIAVAASLAKLFRGGQISANFNARDLWIHSISVATATRLLSDKAGLGLPDEAFLAGLIHDLGIMVEVQVHRTKLIAVLDRMESDSSKPFRELETEIIGTTHEEFGSALCQAWKFPKSFIYVTGYHHRPMELAEEHRPLTGLVHLADIIVANQKLGFCASVELTEMNPELMEQLNLTSEGIDEVIEALPEALEEAMGLLNDSGG